MPAPKRTIRTLSYGLAHPRDLLQKLRHEGDRLSAEPNPYDVFNFVITAAVLAEWIQQDYQTKDRSEPFLAPNKERKEWMLPSECESWMKNLSCFPNRHNGISRHIANVLSICRHTANATKHFHWADGGQIDAIGTEPPIRGFYDWFFTSREKDLYITFEGENYGLQQVKDILLQFYEGLLESREREDSEGEA